MATREVLKEGPEVDGACVEPVEVVFGFKITCLEGVLTLRGFFPDIFIRTDK